MPKVYAIATNVTSALGLGTAANWQAVTSGRTGIKRYEDAGLSKTPFMAAKLGPDQWQVIHEQTKSNKALSPFEQLAVYSAREAIQQCEGLSAADTIFILSTTKGNIELLDQADDDRILLSNSAKVIAEELGITTKPHVISHACVSGVVALIYAMRLLQEGKYKNAIVCGCDRFSRFVLSGFQSFMAISDEPCRPFDAERKGINLGEAAATIILSTETKNDALATLLSGSTSNDANHISGPSRTGEELALAIERTLTEANVSAKAVQMLSAHGTATGYNDEMEAKAFGLAGLLNSEVHSFKGYIGHTLGAAGVVESAMLIESLRRQQSIASPGYETNGVSNELKISRTMQTMQIDYALKTASGFGGCNAAVLWQRAS